MQEQDARTAMVRTQLEQRGIADQRVLHAMAQVPRHIFVPSEVREHAYEDCALPIHEGQTISQPFIVALMAQALELKGDERLLEIGTGSGYAAAVLSQLVGEVYTVERWPSLAQSAERRLRQIGCRNVHVIVADGSAGLPEYAPYNAISVAAASPWVPRPLREQLGDGGRLIIPVGGRNEQYLVRLTRQDVQMKVEKLSGVRFVPLVGQHAWEEIAGENN